MDEQKKGIGRGELIALIVSSCIGTGIFGITSDVAAAAAHRARAAAMEWLPSPVANCRAGASAGAPAPVRKCPAL